MARSSYMRSVFRDGSLASDAQVVANGSLRPCAPVTSSGSLLVNAQDSIRGSICSNAPSMHGPHRWLAQTVYPVARCGSLCTNTQISSRGSHCDDAPIVLYGSLGIYALNAWFGSLKLFAPVVRGGSLLRYARSDRMARSIDWRWSMPVARSAARLGSSNLARSDLMLHIVRSGSLMSRAPIPREWLAPTECSVLDLGLARS